MNYVGASTTWSCIKVLEDMRSSKAFQEEGARLSVGTIE